MTSPLSDRKKLLITGVSGLLGNNLALSFRNKYEVTGLYHSHPVHIGGVKTLPCDLLSAPWLREFCRSLKPDIVIHCASLTNVDTCELNPELARKTNVDGTRNLLESLSCPNVKIVFISTDLVYNGHKGHYSEEDPVHPPNVYGITKYEAEREVLKKENSLILRTNIFGWNIEDKFSLTEWIYHELAGGKIIQGFKDVFFSTIYTFELAKIIGLAIEKDLNGIYNCGGSSFLSKYEFARLIAKKFGLNEELIRPISIDSFALRAKRAKNLSLNINKLAQALDFLPPTIEDSIESYYQDYQSGLPEKIKKERRGPPSYPCIQTIPYGRQSLDNEDIDAVVDVLKSPNLTQGPKIAEFESALCKATAARFAVAVNSGTSALHIASLAAGFARGDEVITSSNTFIASANCIVYCAARPLFADIDPKTYNISANEIEKKIMPRTRGIIPVHFAGQSCDMESIRKIVDKAENQYGKKIWIIEDASHALGSIYKGRQTGSCAYSDMAVMSFHPVKHITTGEGGAVLTNDENLYKKLKRLRNHGITSEKSDFVQCAGEIPPWYYEQIDLGYNYRITDIQCALGLSQLKKLGRFMKRRREIVEYYNSQLGGMSSLLTPYESSKGDGNFHLYVLLIDFQKLGIDRARVILDLKAQGIQTQVHYIPVHTQPFYRKNFGTDWGDLPHTEKYYQNCLSIPLYPAMTDGDVEAVTQAIINQVKIKIR